MDDPLNLMRVMPTQGGHHGYSSALIGEQRRIRNAYGQVTETMTNDQCRMTKEARIERLGFVFVTSDVEISLNISQNL